MCAHARSHMDKEPLVCAHLLCPGTHERTFAFVAHRPSHRQRVHMGTQQGHVRQHTWTGYGSHPASFSLSLFPLAGCVPHAPHPPGLGASLCSFQAHLQCRSLV